ncbi:hypothetical protein MnTg03_01321 [bacterium MnTg03]|nr:hypothetical protein MnTg03_01321 [bacterium MnTg03]
MNGLSTAYDEPHWAQAKCYAVAYAFEHQLDEIAVSLNYVNLFTSANTVRRAFFRGSN